MTSPVRLLDEGDVQAMADRAWVPSHHGQIATEVEWLVFDRSTPERPVGADEVAAAVGPDPLPAGGAWTLEPGGQLELSTGCSPTPSDLLEDLDRDAGELARRIGDAGLVPVDLGLDPIRPPRRSLDLPRYVAMAAAFERQGGSGSVMMCSTASLQINVDFGPDPRASWRDVCSLAPVLAAVFANSPIFLGRPRRQRSFRQQVWAGTDPSRTHPVPTGREDEWGCYALAAEVLMARTGDGVVALPEALSLGDWVRRGHALGFPDAGDVTLHLSTLFPPVRPRRWLELRCLDAVPAPARRVALAAVWALATDAEAGAAAAAACRPLVEPWTAARSGLAEPAMRAAASTCLGLAAEVLEGSQAPLAAEVRGWREGPVAAARTPADDVLDHFEPRAPWGRLAS